MGKSDLSDYLYYNLSPHAFKVNLMAKSGDVWLAYSGETIAIIDTPSF